MSSLTIRDVNGEIIFSASGEFDDIQKVNFFRGEGEYDAHGRATNFYYYTPVKSDRDDLHLYECVHYRILLAIIKSFDSLRGSITHEMLNKKVVELWPIIRNAKTLNDVLCHIEGVKNEVN